MKEMDEKEAATSTEGPKGNVKCKRRRDDGKAQTNYAIRLMDLRIMVHFIIVEDLATPIL